MSITCSKEYTITLAASEPPCFAYFKLNEASPANTLANEVDDFDLAISSGAGVSVPGKLGTALQLPGAADTCRWINGPDAHWVMTGDFTVRFWIKPLYDPAGNDQILWAGAQWSVWLMPNFWAFGKMYLEFLVETNPGSAFVDPPTELNLGAWNHVILWFEQGVGCGAKINNGADILEPAVNPIQAYATLDLNLRRWHDFGSIEMDEIAIWNRKLTAAEMTHDWNSGNGRTYPNVP